MDYKEAIEFIGNVLIVASIKEYDFDDSPGLVDRLQNLDIEDNFKEVIFLLQQGEAYRQIVEELENNYSFLRNDVTRSNKIIYLKSIINDLKQKYLKEAKQDEADNKWSAVKQEWVCEYALGEKKAI